MVQVGDRVELASRKIGQEPRSGLVTSVSGSLLTVRWGSGEESTLIPGPGSLRVVAGGAGAPNKRAAKKAVPAKKAAPAKKAVPAKKQPAAKKAAPAKKQPAAKKAAPAKKQPAAKKQAPQKTAASAKKAGPAKKAGKKAAKKGR